MGGRRSCHPRLGDDVCQYAGTAGGFLGAGDPGRAVWPGVGGAVGMEGVPASVTAERSVSASVGETPTVR